MNGLDNSSITRVRPVFQQLIHRSSNKWLSDILDICPGAYSKDLINNTGSIIIELTKYRKYKDRILRQLGSDFDPIDLEACFEYSLEPPIDFLNWLIKYPDKLVWPKGKKYCEFTQNKRVKLIARDKAVQQEAFSELIKHGPKKSKFKWWAFEGFTEVDCLIETETLVLGFEGKRKEGGPKDSTDWYPERNQIVRNIEALKQIANGKHYAVVLIEENSTILSSDIFYKSLPHKTQQESDLLMSHYLGSITWKDICGNTGLDYDSLPNDITDLLL